MKGWPEWRGGEWKNMKDGRSDLWSEWELVFLRRAGVRGWGWGLGVVSCLNPMILQDRRTDSDRQTMLWIWQLANSFQIGLPFCLSLHKVRIRMESLSKSSAPFSFTLHFASPRLSNSPHCARLCCQRPCLAEMASVRETCHKLESATKIQSPWLLASAHRLIWDMHACKLIWLVNKKKKKKKQGSHYIWNLRLRKVNKYKKRSRQCFCQAVVPSLSDLAVLVSSESRKDDETNLFPHNSSAKPATEFHLKKTLLTWVPMGLLLLPGPYSIPGAGLCIAQRKMTYSTITGTA